MSESIETEKTEEIVESEVTEKSEELVESEVTEKSEEVKTELESTTEVSKAKVVEE